MSTVFSLIRQSWTFLREQQTLGPVVLLYLFVPSLISNVLPVPEPTDAIEFKILLVFAQILLGLLLTFGVVCILSIAKRLLQAKSGRKKTSLKAVQKQAYPSFLPFLLTGILRGVFTFFWALPIIIVASTLFPYADNANIGRQLAYAFLVCASALPALRYIIGTSLYGVLSVCEGVSYRECLRLSKQLVFNRFWATTTLIVLLTVILTLPAQLIASLLLSVTQDAGYLGKLAGSAAASFLITLSLALYLPALVALYNHIRPVAKGEAVTGTIN